VGWLRWKADATTHAITLAIQKRDKAIRTEVIDFVKGIEIRVDL
jgi:hypothetical protein